MLISRTISAIGDFFGGQPVAFYMCMMCVKICRIACSLTRHRSQELRNVTFKLVYDDKADVSKVEVANATFIFMLVLSRTFFFLLLRCTAHSSTISVIQSWVTLLVVNPLLLMHARSASRSAKVLADSPDIRIQHIETLHLNQWTTLKRMRQ